MTVDNSVPRLAISWPFQSEVLEGLITVEVHATDGAGLARVSVLVDGSERPCDSDGAEWLCSIDTSGLEDGEHVIGALARDIAGRTATAEVTVRVDNGPPVLTVSFPRLNDYPCGTVSVEASAQDAFLQRFQSGIAT